MALPALVLVLMVAAVAAVAVVVVAMAAAGRAGALRLAAMCLILGARGRRAAVSLMPLGREAVASGKI